MEPKANKTNVAVGRRDVLVKGPVSSPPPSTMVVDFPMGPRDWKPSVITLEHLEGLVAKWWLPKRDPLLFLTAQWTDIAPDPLP